MTINYFFVVEGTINPYVGVMFNFQIAIGREGEGKEMEIHLLCFTDLNFNDSSSMGQF